MLIQILTAVAVLGLMGLIFGALLSVASRFFFVKEDERKEQIIEALPGANCGGCGYSGCAAYADAVLAGKAGPNVCPVGGQTSADAICKIMGLESAPAVRKYARVRCSGNNEVAVHKYQYEGLDDCVAATRLLDGYMQCRFGCLGFGNCVRHCPVGAIEIKNGVAVIDKETCVGCSVCVATCPKQVIEIVPYETKYAVGCSSHDKGAATRKNCRTGCIGCKLCEKACEFDAIHVTDSLAVIDYDKCTGCGACAEKCPSHIIFNISD